MGLDVQFTNLDAINKTSSQALSPKSVRKAGLFQRYSCVAAVCLFTTEHYGLPGWMDNCCWHQLTMLITRWQKGAAGLSALFKPHRWTLHWSFIHQGSCVSLSQHMHRRKERVKSRRLVRMGKPVSFAGSAHESSVHWGVNVFPSPSLPNGSEGALQRDSCTCSYPVHYHRWKGNVPSLCTENVSSKHATVSSNSILEAKSNLSLPFKSGYFNP